MTVSRNRDIARFLGKTEKNNTSNLRLTHTGDGSGLVVYATKENLPATGLTSGDQAFVTNTSRLYISNGSGWYNVALINATPSLTIDPTGAITLAKDGSTPTVITLTATDSDNAVAGLTFSVDSDGSFGGLATISQDSSVFTITPLSGDSATTSSSTLTFKASDGISFGSGTRTLSLTFRVTNSNYTTLLLQADTAGTDDQVDASTNNHTITEAGNVTSTALTPYHPGGYSILYDGNSDSLSVAADTSLDLGTGDFTMEAWVHPTATSNNYPSFMSSVTGWSSNASGHRFDNTGYAGRFGFYLHGAGGRNSGNPFMHSTNTFTHDDWYHYAVTRSGNTFKMYINGVLEDTQTTSNSYNAAHGGFRSGGSFDGGAGYFAGYVRDVRIVKGSVVYTGAFTPPTSSLTAISGTSLLICHAPYIADGSTNSHAITTAGTTQTRRFSPYDYESYAKAKHGGSVYFDGNGDYIGIPDDDGFELTGDFAIECWFYRNSVASGTYCTVIGGNGSGSNGWNIYITNSNGTISFFHSSFLLTYAEGVQNNIWYHVAVTRSGTDLKLFVNGIERASATNSSTFNQNDGNLGTRIGYDINANGYFNGYVTDARVVKGSAVYTAAFTPPTAPLTAITNTQLLTCTNKNNIWDASGTHITKFGNTTASNTNRKFTTSSAIYVDGTGDYLVTDLGRNIGTGDFTIEGWVWADQNLHKGIFQISSDANGLTTSYVPTLSLLFQPGYGWQIYGRGGAHNSSGPTAITLSQWYHFAYVKTASASKLYIDGVEVITGSDTQNYAVRYIAIGGSYSTGYLWNGYIQDMRISFDLARYTSNFTPPTAEFSG